MSEWVHATAVLAGASGILVRGPSGSGKSALAAALIGRGARLVADDRIHLSARSGRLIATAPGAIAGKLELRGRGIVALPYERIAVIRLVVDIVPAGELPRQPEPGEFEATLLGVTLPRQPVPLDAGRAVSLIDAALAAHRPGYRHLRWA